eukprot:TRINITY_DN11989_c0_g1_i1.p1 TRINITY_DN11989_c0_g1~~TRINITY_DN11989_c0_g1_i1.p1  ORF type:complete len:130 (+),score=34.02 TRINITY_DN11989_c0_g1_i1:50-391(+)
MGCAGSSTQAYDEEPEPVRQQPRKPTKTIEEIMNMNKVDTSVVPSGFPSRPSEPVAVGFDDENAYKEYMRKKLVYDKWESSLTSYNMRKKEGNEEACNNIIERLREAIDEINW